MSREIKFRAWDEKNRQFADYEDIEECLSCQAMDGWRSSDGIGCCFGINAVEILADCIIEQYTGLKDKNGKEIYEGDIVKVYYRNTRWKLCGKYGVFWDDLNAHYVLSKSEDTDEADFVLGGFNYKYEVIGNIHENQELLGGIE